MHEMVTLLRVDPPTISRRLMNAREQIYKDTRRRYWSSRDLTMGTGPYELIILAI